MITEPEILATSAVAEMHPSEIGHSLSFDPTTLLQSSSKSSCSAIAKSTDGVSSTRELMRTLE